MTATTNVVGDVKHLTDEAVLLDDGTKDHWLPLSQVTLVDGELEIGEIGVVLEIPVWLAIDKGLV